jgi:hypothetical protein
MRNALRIGVDGEILSLRPVRRVGDKLPTNLSTVIVENYQAAPKMLASNFARGFTLPKPAVQDKVALFFRSRETACVSPH